MGVGVTGLVGKRIKMPDYLVLFSTLGMSLLDITGFVAGQVIAALFMFI